MKKVLVPVIAFWLLAADLAEVPHWHPQQVSRLTEWLISAANDGLEPVSADAAKVRAAAAANDPAALDRVATSAAVRLVRAYRTGCCHASAGEGWNIRDSASQTDPAIVVANALTQNRLDDLLSFERPSHPNYLALRRAYKAEKDPVRHRTIAANLDRWRWMPRSLGSRYLLVNAAAFEATLWEGRQQVGRWEIIVGKTRSPTPVFAAKVTGVTFNPWWEIPSSIVAESVGSLMAKRPTEAARKGYVIQNGRYRQRPGPDNALGQMKLVMPNPYSVYLHDTPAQSLFERDVRALSHGCVRVGDALGLATALLSAQPGWNRAQVDAIITGGQTVTVPLDQPIPVYVAYFTAEPDDLGSVRYFPDIYKRDQAVSLPEGDKDRCSL